jgi:hypothetical protein
MTTKYIALLIAFFFMSACHTTHHRPDFQAPANSLVMNAQFKHLTFFQEGKGERLHVYIEGDGRPFRNRFLIAQDPSPQNPLILNLMMQDKNFSLYLGRPCYFSKSMPTMRDTQCNPNYWTSARYSEDVVNSMIAALQQHLSTHPRHGISLIGHSGGGTLAMLMAARMPEVDQVVTLAGNLDIKAWADLHHYTPLHHSLNPADLVILYAKQLHFGGENDGNIPPRLSETWLTSMGQTMHIIKDADHTCCWQQHWNNLLTQINQQMAP